MNEEKGPDGTAEYIATFFSHFGAAECARTLKGKGITARLSSVPRYLSSSCGTCVRFFSADGEEARECEDLEGIFPAKSK